MNSQLESNESENRSRAETPAILDFVRNTARVFLGCSAEEFQAAADAPRSNRAILDFFFHEKTRLLFASFKGPAPDQPSRLVEFFNFSKDVVVDRNHVVLFFKKGEILASKILQSRSYLKSTISVVNFGILKEGFNLTDVVADCVKNTYIPIFKGIAGERTAEPDARGNKQESIAAISKILAGLDANLNRRGQSQEIPRIRLEFHPALAEICRTCVQRGVEPTVEMIPKAMVEDSTFIDQLAEQMNRWVHETEMLFEYGNDYKVENVENEVTLWRNIFESLEDVKRQFDLPEVKLTINVLQSKKRVNMKNMDSIKELDKKIKPIEKIHQSLSAMNFDQMMRVSDLQELGNDINQVFNQLRQLIQGFGYNNARLKNLMEVVNKEYWEKAFDCLRKMGLLGLEHLRLQETYSKLKTSTFNKWDMNLEQTYEKIKVLRKMEVSDFKKGKDNKGLLFKRFERLIAIRQNYEAFQNTFSETVRNNPAMADLLKAKDFPTVADVNHCFEVFREVDLMDLTPAGDAALEKAVSRYEKHVCDVEQVAADKIKAIFGELKSDNEQFKFYRKFFFFFKRDYIRKELLSLHNRFIRIIEDDQRRLIEVYKKRNEQATAPPLVKKLNMPPAIYRHVWIEQLIKAMKANLERLKLVLDDKFNQDPKGKELTQIGENFLKQISKGLEDTYAELEQAYSSKADEKIIGLKTAESGKANKLVMNFNAESKRSIKTMKYFYLLKPDLNKKYYLKYIFTTVNLKSYNLSYYIRESVKTFNALAARMKPVETKLLAKLLKDCYKRIEAAQEMKWFQEDNAQPGSKIEKFTLMFATDVATLDENVTYVSKSTAEVDQSLKELSEVECDLPTMEVKIRAIQVVVNNFRGRGYKNLHVYIAWVNEQIEHILMTRLESIIRLWTHEFNHFDGEKTRRHLLRESAKNEEADVLLDSDFAKALIKEMIFTEIKVENQSVFLDPPLENARLFCLSQLQSMVSQICALSKIRSEAEGEERNFSELMAKVDVPTLLEAYTAINSKLAEANAYLATWRNYQALWDIDVNKVQELLGIDAQAWETLLNDIIAGKASLETKQNVAYFGPISINFKIAKKKINNKYDGLHREILNYFGKNLNNQMLAFFEEIRRTRERVESIDLMDSLNIINSISTLNYCSEHLDQWAASVRRFDSGEHLLLAQAYYFPSNWKQFSMLEAEWNRFRQAFEVKKAAYRDEFDSIRARLLKEEDGLKRKVNEIETMWNNKKPYSGALHPKEALEIIETLEKTIGENRANFEKLNSAKTLLGLPIIDLSGINSIADECAGLKDLWKNIQDHWKAVDGIGETLVRASNPVKFGQVFDEILEKLNSLPKKYMSYDALVTKKKELGALKKSNKLLKELKNEAIKDQHWEQILQKVKLTKKFKNLTFLDFHRHNVAGYEKVISDIVASAQGELVLENMIKKIRDFWNAEEFVLSKYQEKTMLIKGWDDMLGKLEDDLAQIGSMKLSQHYKTFEEEVKSWNDKLVTVQSVLDVWVNVQRKWVYLEGIFFGSSDIAQQLPNEYAKFRTIDSDFTALMKRTQQKMKILDVILNTPNLQKSLQILYDTLEKIQKALSEYLETQRQAFARFYFVGDEDLLEIIGNSKDVTNVQKFFSKMFAGVNFVENEEHGVRLVGMRSKENETISFTRPFLISAKPKINEWLTEVEYQMQASLANNFEAALKTWGALADSNIRALADAYPAQDVLVSFQTFWTFLIGEGKLQEVIDRLLGILDFMAEEVLTELPKLTRSKYEQLITEFVHKRDVTRSLLGVPNALKSFDWAAQMRFYSEMTESEVTKRLKIKMGNSIFVYGYEYLGISEKLVQTPLTDKCYFTLTQALWLRMGGAPFGPAGTGKTESVKALGNTLGRFVLVFNCDETFNFKAMSRIFIGLCQVGAWGCFDEFNRLEERILSAVSQQILTIQAGLRENASKVEMMSRDVKLNPNMGIFVTMNPGYAGRSNLPENLKQLFRQMAMIKPDRQLIAQVMLFSQGFKSAEQLSGKVVSLFELCNDQLSSQPHYDFGLRALKSVLNSAGNLKRAAINENKEKANQPVEEQQIILRSFSDTVIPKLISEDAPLLQNLIKGVFPEANIIQVNDTRLREAIVEECTKRNLLLGENFVEKIFQLHQILKLQHGVMLVGPTGCGKSNAWKVLLASLSKAEGGKGESYIIDPKAINKDDLYGKLDNTTMEWTDGIFTSILRKVGEAAKGETSKRHWIVFDGDVDPEWAENLNSVLDDNKLLTLPNGERIQIPSNVKIMFEVESLKHATLATVSRCGMVWFSEDVLLPYEIFYNYTQRLKCDVYDQKIQESQSYHPIREKCVTELEPLFYGNTVAKLVKDGRIRIQMRDSLAWTALDLARGKDHVMEFSDIRVLEGLFALVRKGIDRVVDYNEQNPDFPLDSQVYVRFIKGWTLLALQWAFVGDLKLQKRADYWAELNRSFAISGIDLPPTNDQTTLIDYAVELKTGEWVLWKNKVPQTEVDEAQLTNADTIITTVDTLRHQEFLCSYLLERRPFIICGPPGSGKTMTLMSTLKGLPNYDMIFVNFSSSTTPELILKHFEHYCEYVKSNAGVVLKPRQLNRNLILFCDEINLPDEDKYGTQCVITFLRQLTEQNGFWRNSDKQWIGLDRIQFVGACNPPTDAGRHPLSPRMLRHCPLLLVDFPGYDSLVQIYGTFNKAMLARNPELRDMWKELTTAMVEYYSQSQRRFTADQQPHYIYSPRELTRWKYAINEALMALNSQEDLVRLWAHEALRLFEDRLLTEEEKDWCQEALDRIASQTFRSISTSQVLKRPILFSTYLTKSYQSADQDDLRKYIIAKLRTFNEEEYSIQLVVFDSVVEHIVRIDRVLRQPIGHLLLVGASGVGKTTLSRFVSWMNGLSVFQIKAGRNYSLADFDANLREVMKRAGCKGEKITFIFDESNVLSVAFMERMNALLASGEIPGLFDGDEFVQLINFYKENQSGKRIQTDEEIYASFTKNVQRNLHIVFTMNPAGGDFSNRAASSPAIFNRCVIDWFGDWSEEALYQVARELTERMEVTQNSLEDTDASPQDVLVGLIVKIHNSVRNLNDQLRKGAKRFNFLTPRDFLDFIKHLMSLREEKSSLLIEQERHLTNGLDKLKETEASVSELDQSLEKFKVDLDRKKREADEKMELIQKEVKTGEEKEVQLRDLSGKLAIKKEEIERRSEIVQKDLDKAGPALEAAKKAVSSITAKELNDIRVLNNPPKLIKLTMAAVCTLLKQTEQAEWKDIQGIMRSKDFIGEIMNLSIDSIKESVKTLIHKKYIKSEDWNIPNIYKSYKAAGILAEWLESQLSYNEILRNVDPMRQEIAALQSDLTELEQQQQVNKDNLELTQRTIEKYKSDYTELIAKVENIKADMEKVNVKVRKSKNLLGNLSSEKVRWSESSRGFASQIACMTGDVLLCAAFLAYGGFFDQLYRNLLLRTWKDYLRAARLKFKPDLIISAYLSTPSERMLWQAAKLPNDELCSENAIIIKRHNRYPLVIDPSYQALHFILDFYADKKIEKTSFDEPNFMKVLEKCLRFGLPVLIQNVEKIEPLLNSVLNKEVVRQGGRNLVRVGDQEIDFHESFRLFMITNNSEPKFTPDLCSRVTFVNFTVTLSSLENQCVNIYLRNERPDVEKSRITLLKLQGEFLLKIRELEDDLLTKISEQTGSILENDALIATLDNLKVRANEVTEKMRESTETLKVVESVTEEYRHVAFISAKIYFILLSFSSLNVLYQFSFQFYMKILMAVLLADPVLQALPKDQYAQRIAAIKERLFVSVFRKLQVCVLERDKLLVALRFCQLNAGPKYSEFFRLLIEPPNVVETTLGPLLDGKLDKAQLVQLENIAKNPRFAGLLNSVRDRKAQWVKFLTEPGDDLPMDWFDGADALAASLAKLVVVSVLKPTKAFTFMNAVIGDVMGEEFAKKYFGDLKELIENDSEATSPIFLATAPGFDPSYKIDSLSKSLGRKYEAIAIGSAEGFVAADKALDRAVKGGSWVIFKNVHLACSWLSELEVKFSKLKPHANFRLFLVSEFNEKLPVTLLRQSTKMIFELPEGIRSNVLRILGSTVNPEKMQATPKERIRLYFQAIWLHSVIMERLRYIPIGWSKFYEFSEADLRCTIEVIDQFLEKGDDPKSHLHALRCIITNNIYGGKIDNEFDLKILRAVVDQYMNEAFFDPKHHFIRTADFTIPNFAISDVKSTVSWVEDIAAAETPIWAGLPLAAEEVLLKKRLENLYEKLMVVQDINEEEIMEIKEDTEASAGQQFKWLKELAGRCRTYLSLLPKAVPLLVRNEVSILNPLFRFADRETTLCSKLSSLINGRLQNLVDMAEGRLQPLQDLKILAKTVYSGEVPSNWKRFTNKDLNVSAWLQDFKNRLDQIAHINSTKDWQRKGFNLGLMLFPEAFLTASRQYVAQLNKLSLDELELKMAICEESTVDENSFLVEGLTMEGVKWSHSGLSLENEIAFRLKSVKFTWVKSTLAASKALAKDEILVPIYLNSSRKTLLTAVKFKVTGDITEQVLYQKGIAIIAWNH